MKASQLRTDVLVTVGAALIHYGAIAGLVRLGRLGMP